MLVRWHLKCVLAAVSLISAAAQFTPYTHEQQVIIAKETEASNQAVGVSVAATLIGAVSFIMCLYYFLNWHDEDIQKFSWELLSSTISIFCAVLMFQAFNDLVEAYIIDAFHLSIYEEAALDLGHFLFWYVSLQVSLCKLSGAVGGVDAIKHLPFLEQEQDKDRREVNLKCWSVLLAHLTGFASINAWGTVQHLPYFSSSPGRSFLSVPIALVGQVCLQRITDFFRERISLDGDGFKDLYERMWDEEAEEAENDVMGLTISFCLTNALRYTISGCFPNQEGKEEPGGNGCYEDSLYTHTFEQKAQLQLLGLLFCFLIFMLRVCLPEWLFLEEEEEEDSDEDVGMEEPTQSAILEQQEESKWEFWKRLFEGCFTSISMSFSWCAFFGVQMVLAGFKTFQGEANAELSQVVLAISLSLSVFAFMVLLDKVADAGGQPDASNFARKGAEGVRDIMTAFSLLVGFAWEQCFDQSVDSLAAVAKPPLNQHSAKLFLSVFCASLLVPAWKAYILPFIVAKGWRYGSCHHPDHIGHVIRQMIEHPDVVPGSKKQRAKIDRIMTGLQGVHYLSMGADGKLHDDVLVGAGGQPGGEEIGDFYIELPEVDVTALKRENRQLRQALDKANKELQLKSKALDVITALR